MPRSKLIRSDIHPYHITMRSNNREWFTLPMPIVWKKFIKSLEIASNKHPAIIHGFVLMSNHYHLIIETPNANIDKFMYYVNKNFSKEVRKPTQRINRIFGARYKWSLITNKQYYLNTMKYIFLNPIRANIIEKVEDYPYSSLFCLTKGEHFQLNLKPYEDFNQEDYISWINDGFTENQSLAIKKGLRRTEFAPTDTKSKSKTAIF